MKFIQLLFYQPVLLTTLGLLTISPPVLADLQTSENYVLSATVLSNGSGEANSSEYSLTATVGTPFAETAAENQSLLSSLLQLQTTVEVKEVGQGQQHITYTVTITNLGTETATGIIFTDIIPAGTKLLTIKADSSGKDCEKKTVSCELPDLAPNASIQVELVVQNKLGEAPANVAQVNSDNYPASVDVIPDEITPPVPTPPEIVAGSTETTTPPSETETMPTEPTTVTAPSELEPVTAPPQLEPVTAPPQTETVTAPSEPEIVTAPPEPEAVTAPVETVVAPVQTVVTPPETETVTAPKETVIAPSETETVTAPKETVIAPSETETVTALPVTVITPPLAPVTPPAEADVPPTDTPPAEPTTVAPPTPPVVIAPPIVFIPAIPCPTEGTVNVACNAGGQTIGLEAILPGGQISNGVLEHRLTSQGWVSNLTITSTGELIGGVVTGYIKNQGMMRDFEFKGMSLKGGKLGGHIRNTSRTGGFFQDVTLLPNTQITGGTLKGTIKGDPHSPALLEQVRIKSGSHLSGVKLGKGVKLEKGVIVEKE